MIGSWRNYDHCVGVWHTNPQEFQSAPRCRVSTLETLALHFPQELRRIGQPRVSGKSSGCPALPARHLESHDEVVGVAVGRRPLRESKGPYWPILQHSPAVGQPLLALSRTRHLLCPDPTPCPLGPAYGRQIPDNRVLQPHRSGSTRYEKVDSARALSP